MNRDRCGAAAWIGSAVLFTAAQQLVALQWPQGYSVTDNAISDLGVTRCGQFSEQGHQVREVCSPWHSLFNAGEIATGLLILIGSLLLHGRWGGRSGRAGTAVMALSGALLSIVGLAPWDTHQRLHDDAALAQAVATWVAMGLLAAAAGPGPFRRLTTVTLLVSVAGFVVFLAALEGAEVLWLGFGGVERLSFDTLTLWTLLVGATVFARPAITPRSEAVVPR